MKSQVPRRLKQIKRYYLDQRMAERHCQDIEAYFHDELRKYIRYACDEILKGSVLTRRQRVDFVRGWMSSYLRDLRDRDLG